MARNIKKFGMFENILNNDLKNTKDNPMDSSSGNDESFLTKFFTLFRYTVLCIIIILIILISCPTYQCKIDNYPPLKPDKSDNQISIYHPAYKIKVTINYWPPIYKSICFYQFCNLIHKIIYGKCRKTCESYGKEFCKHRGQRYFFDKPDIDGEGFVLDSVGKDKTFYSKITEENYQSGNNILKFQDQPSGHWDKYNKKHKLERIHKSQNFKVFLVGVKESNKLDILASWTWGYTMIYFNGKAEHELRNLILTNDELPEHLINLPNANSCMYKTACRYGLPSNKYPKRTFPSNYIAKTTYHNLYQIPLIQNLYNLFI